jgi:hypothetical protein
MFFISSSVISDFFIHGLELIHGVAADIADGHLALSPYLRTCLTMFLSALLV